LANGEFDHDRCEATVSTVGANHDIMSARKESYYEVGKIQNKDGN
jgi:hypothetical protein